MVKDYGAKGGALTDVQDNVDGLTMLDLTDDCKLGSSVLLVVYKQYTSAGLRNALMSNGEPSVPSSRRIVLVRTLSLTAE